MRYTAVGTHWGILVSVYQISENMIDYTIHPYSTNRIGLQPGADVATTILLHRHRCIAPFT